MSISQSISPTCGRRETSLVVVLSKSAAVHHQRPIAERAMNGRASAPRLEARTFPNRARRVESRGASATRPPPCATCRAGPRSSRSRRPDVASTSVGDSSRLREGARGCEIEAEWPCVCPSIVSGPRARGSERGLKEAVHAERRRTRTGTAETRRRRAWRQPARGVHRRACTAKHGGSEESEGAPQDREIPTSSPAVRASSALPKTASSMTKPRKTAKPTGSAADFIPPRPTLTKLRAAAKGCRGCDLFKCGTQTVFGEGPARARVMFVGEQPGDQEDKAGRPFVGPAGKLLDRAFDAAGIDRDDVYVTNAVKHFKWARDARTKRRIHKTPSAGEIRACHPWLEQEIALVQPGGHRLPWRDGRESAARPRLQRHEEARNTGAVRRGRPRSFATVHPSAVLRAPPDQRARAERMFVADIRKVARYPRHRNRQQTTASGFARIVNSPHGELQRRRPTSQARRPGPRARNRSRRSLPA